MEKFNNSGHSFSQKIPRRSQMVCSQIINILYLTSGFNDVNVDIKTMNNTELQDNRLDHMNQKEKNFKMWG